MKKLTTTTFFVAIFAIGFPALAQQHLNPILKHALELRSLVTEIKEDDGRLIIPYSEEIDTILFNVLSYYSAKIDKAAIAREFEDLNEFFKVGVDISALSDSEPVSKPSFISSLSSLNVTNFAFGLTDFLIDRTKTELNIAFFERFKDEMTKDEYNDLKILFPQTFQMLTAIGDQMYYYNNYIQGLRHAFETDLNRMPYQIRNWVDLHKDSIDASVYYTIRIGLITTTSIIENKHPGAILKDLSTELKSLNNNENDSIFGTFENITHLVSLISESFRDTLGAGDYWVDGSKIRQLTNDEVLLRIYLGLLYQQIKLDSAQIDIAFSNDITLLNLLDTIGKNWNVYSFEANRLISRFSSQINLTQSSVTRFNETKRRVNANDELTNRERNYEMFNAYFDITTSMLDILRNIGLEMNEFAEGINKIDTAVGQKLQAIFSEKKFKEIDTLIIANIEAAHKIGIFTFNKQYAGAVAQTFMLLNRADANKNNQWQAFIKYGTFMANMVTADSPEAVTAAIEAVAAPPGSYSIKRHSNFSIALNGYLGVFGGQEFISGMDNAWNASITAPVGISFNWKRCENKNVGWVVPTSIFASIIDLGVITNYRLTETNDVSSVPKVKLNNIISPGIFLEWRLGKSPLTLGAGGQFGPQIREQIIKDDMGNITGKELISEALYWRAGLSLKVDIPILYFKK